MKKEQYFIFMDILSLNINKEYYDARLARELDISDSNRDFRKCILLMKEHNAIEFQEKIGSAHTYIINRKQLMELIANTDIFKLTHEKFIICGLGDNYRVWDYK